MSEVLAQFPPSEIRNLLFEQVTSPVRWDESVKNMSADGATKFIEVGPEKVLQGLVKRTVASAEVSGIDKAVDVKL